MPVATQAVPTAVVKRLAGADCWYEPLLGWTKLALGAVTLWHVAACVVGKKEWLRQCLVRGLPFTLLAVVVLRRAVVLCLSLHVAALRSLS